VKTVCIDCRYIGPRPSGIAEVVRGLVDHLPALAPDLRFLLLRHPAHEGRLSDAENVTEQVVKQAANGPATMWWLPRVVDLSGVDLFHATANIMPAGLPMPCVVTVHDIMWLTRPRWCGTGFKGRIDRQFYGHGIMRALRSAEAIATVSGATAAEIAAFHPPGAERTTVTLSGVSRRFRPVASDPAALQALGLVPGRAFVLTVGQYSPYKNHEGAIRGFAQAFARRMDIDLVLVQRSGPRGDRLLDLARRLGMGGRVHVLPAVSDDALLALYCAATALLHPSFCEGFGNPVAEAMACGCPVVTSGVSAMAEVAGGAARLVDPSETASIAAGLRDVTDDPGRAIEMRAAGLLRAGDLQWGGYAEANLAIYRRVLGSGA
jgi:glycosyltransferase involved in cell wall biosynthesis